MIQLFEKLNREQGTTLVMVTHDPLFAERASRRVSLKDGRVIADSGSPVLPTDGLHECAQSVGVSERKAGVARGRRPDVRILAIDTATQLCGVGVV